MHTQAICQLCYITHIARGIACVRVLHSCRRAPQLAPPLIPFVPFRCTVRVRRSVPPPPPACSALLWMPMPCHAVRWCMCAGHDGHSGRLQADAASPPTPVRFTCYSIPSVCCVFHSSPPTDPATGTGCDGNGNRVGVRGPWDFDLECRLALRPRLADSFLLFHSIHAPGHLHSPSSSPHTGPSPSFLVHAAVVQTKRLFLSCAPGSASREIWRCRGCANRPEESDQKYRRRPQESRFHLSQSAFGISGQLAARTRLVVGLGWLAASVLMDLRRRSTNLMAAWRFLWVTDSHPLLFVCVRARDAA